MLRLAVLPLVLLAVFVSSPLLARDFGCIGSHHVREFGSVSNPGQEWETTHYRFRNFNADRALMVERIEIVAEDGTPLRVFEGTSWPPDFNPALGPKQSSGFELRDVFGDIDAPGGSLLQVIVTYRRGGGAAPLFVTAGRLTRTVGGQGGQRDTRARSIVPCMALR